jgi:hypothetical protein
MKRLFDPIIGRMNCFSLVVVSPLDYKINSIPINLYYKGNEHTN